MMKSCFINASYAIHPNGVLGEDGVYHAIEPDYKNILTDLNQRRRMSRVVKMGVSCALLCLQQHSVKELDAILTATGLGCLADTEKFINSIIDNDERLLNPTPFIQSTFNVIGAQIALTLNSYAYNNTYTHRALSFETALLDAQMHINEGANNVLLGGMDEVTATSHHIMQRLGIFRNIREGEGAQFFVLSDQQTEYSKVEFLGLKTCVGNKSADDICLQINALLADNELCISDVELLMVGENGCAKEDSIYTEIKKTLLPLPSILTFKDSCGEYHTASSFALWKLCSHLQQGSVATGTIALIYNQFNTINHSLMLVRKC